MTRRTYSESTSTSRLRDGCEHDVVLGPARLSLVWRYQHVLDAIRKDVADQVGGLLWEGIEIGPADVGREQDDGTDEDAVGPETA